MRFFYWLIRLIDALSGRPRKRRSLVMSDAEQFETRAMLSAIVVTTPLDLSDSLPGDGRAETSDGQTSLRSAVQEANALPGFDTIQLPPGTFELNLPDDLANDASGGDLDISDHLSIRGAGPDETVIDARQIDQLFELTNGSMLELHDLTLRTGDLNNIVNAVDGLAPLDNVALIEIDSVVADPIDDSLEGIAEDTEPENNPLPIPLPRFEFLSSNSRQLQLLQSLSLPVQPVVAVTPVTVNPVASHADRLDATIGMASATSWAIVRSAEPGTRIADNNPNIPKDGPRQLLPNAGPRVADSKNNPNPNQKTNPNDTSAKRRSDVVNSLFEKNRNDKNQVSPVGAKSNPSSNGADKPDAMPALLPTLEGFSPKLKPNPVFPLNETNRPAPPPLPDSFRDEHSSVGRNHQSSDSPVLAAGILFAFARPTTWQRAIKKLKQRK
jgi:hypothetical protein